MKDSKDPLFPWEEIRQRYAPSPLWGASQPLTRSVADLDAKLMASRREVPHPAHPQLGVTGGIAAGVDTDSEEAEAKEAEAFLRKMLGVREREADFLYEEGEKTNPGFDVTTQDANGNAYHEPVLPAQVLTFIAPRDGGVYVDATLGSGGHAESILEANETASIIGIDQDHEAIARATARLQNFGARFTALRGNFEDLPALLENAGRVVPIDGVLMDLGVSSHHFDEAARGFSFSGVGPLDMRMDQRQETTAADLVNTLPQADLARILREFGEEPKAARIAAEILRTRAATPLHTTGDLVQVVLKVYGPAAGRSRRHPATKTFQALRIAVNRELDVLRSGLTTAFDVLRPGGRLVAISFHSLEDRIVKQFMKGQAAGCVCPPEVPVCACGQTPSGKILTRKVVIADETEVNNNPRSRSAKLRAVEKL